MRDKVTRQRPQTTIFEGAWLLRENALVLRHRFCCEPGVGAYSKAAASVTDLAPHRATISGTLKKEEAAAKYPRLITQTHAD